MRKEVVPGEWQEDANGKKYRMVGNIKEYETTIRIGGVEIPESQLEDYNKRRKEREQAALQAQKAEAARKAALPKYHCPFNHNGLNSVCRNDECAFFNGNDCIIRQVDAEPKASQGKRCPIDIYNRQCNNDCAFYKDKGCILPGIISNLTQKGCANNE